MATSPAGGRPGDRLRYSSSGKASTAVMRDENEAPNNGARLSVCSAARLLRLSPRADDIPPSLSAQRASCNRPRHTVVRAKRLKRAVPQCGVCAETLPCAAL